MLIENPLHEIKTLPTNFFFFNRLFSKSSFRELLGGPKVRTHHSHCRAQVPLLGELKFRVHQNFFGAAKKKKSFRFTEKCNESESSHMHHPLGVSLLMIHVALEWYMCYN